MIVRASERRAWGHACAAWVHRPTLASGVESSADITGNLALRNVSAARRQEGDGRAAGRCQEGGDSALWWSSVNLFLAAVLHGMLHRL